MGAQSRFQITETQFLALLVKHEAALRGYARAIIPDWSLIDEAIQEASVTMWQKKGQLESAEGFLPWAKVILRFKCLHQLEKLRSQRPLFSDDLIHSLASKGEEERNGHQANAARDALESCLQQFSRDHRELLLAPYRSDFKIKDLAERQSKTPNALYKMLARLKMQLSDCIRLRLPTLGEQTT